MQEVSTQCRRGTDTLETFIGEKNNKKKKGTQMHCRDPDGTSRPCCP